MTKKSKLPITAIAKPAASTVPTPLAAKRDTKKAAPKPLPAKIATPLKVKVKAAPPTGGSKIDTVVTMLCAKHGASIEQLSTATGWQSHSVRGAISGAIKKKLGLNVISERINGALIYRIAK